MLTSATDLLEQIVAGEDPSLELKEVGFRGATVSDPSRNQLADELAAFANARGGALVLGFDGGSKDVVGIPLANLDTVEQHVIEVCHDSIDPPLDVTTQKLSIPDSLNVQRWVLRVHVERSLAVHHSPSGYMRRVGSSKRKMAQDQLGQLFQQRSQARLIRFDETVVPETGLSDLELTLLGRFRTSRTADNDRTLATKLGMAAEHDFGVFRLTVAGVLLGTRRPEQWLRHAFIQAVAYRGNRIGSAMDEPNYQLDAKDIVGPLDTQVAEACRFVARNQSVAAYRGGGRTDFPQYDMTAVFEALVNAVAHRDYSMHGSKIRLRMFADRLELYSPGELASTMTPETLAYRQSTRNEAIASLLARCTVPGSIPGLRSSRSALMDRRGEGVPLILDRSEEISGRRPLYQTVDGAELLLTIYGAAQDAP